MKKSDYANYLRQRLLSRSSELSNTIGMSKANFEDVVKRRSDQATIDSYRFCSNCGQEWLTRQEMDSLILKYNDPGRIFNEIPSGCE